MTYSGSPICDVRINSKNRMSIGRIEKAYGKRMARSLERQFGEKGLFTVIKFEPWSVNYAYDKEEEKIYHTEIVDKPMEQYNPAIRMDKSVKYRRQESYQLPSDFFARRVQKHLFSPGLKHKCNFHVVFEMITLLQTPVSHPQEINVYIETSNDSVDIVENRLYREEFQELLHHLEMDVDMEKGS
jgi:hypothetical protein